MGQNQVVRLFASLPARQLRFASCPARASYIAKSQTNFLGCQLYMNIIVYMNTRVDSVELVPRRLTSFMCCKCCHAIHVKFNGCLQLM